MKARLVRDGFERNVMIYTRWRLTARMCKNSQRDCSGYQNV